MLETTSEPTILTPHGNLTYTLLTPAELAPAPALLLTFATTRQAALGEPPQEIPAQRFAAAGHHVLSFDLPHHGDQINHLGQGIEGFCAAICAGADPFAQFVEQAQAVIDTCLAQGMGQGGIVACGVSRAAYCVLRLAAADARIGAVAGLAPVTDWRPLREFAAVREQPAVAALALDHWADQLAGRPVFLVIGNADARVSSAACLRLGLRLGEIEEARGITHSALQLHVVEASGHALPDHWRQAGAEFLLAHLYPCQSAVSA